MVVFNLLSNRAVQRLDQLLIKHVLHLSHVILYRAPEQMRGGTRARFVGTL